MSDEMDESIANKNNMYANNSLKVSSREHYKRETDILNFYKKI